MPQLCIQFTCISGHYCEPFFSPTTVPTAPAPQPTIVFQPMQSSAAGQRSQGAVYSLTSCYLVPASSSRSETTPDLFVLASPSRSEAAPDLLLPSSSSRSSQNRYSSSISKPGIVSNPRADVSYEALGGIAAAVLVLTMAIVILITISTYVYCTMAMKKHKGKYRNTETESTQLAVISYHVGSKDEVVVSCEEPDDISPKKLLNYTTSSSERSYRESLRNRGVSLSCQQND